LNQKLNCCEITEWSTKRGVSFVLVKTNKTCYTIVCIFTIEVTMFVKMCAHGDFMPRFLRVLVDTSRLDHM